jgi:hypothetical protein
MIDASYIKVHSGYVQQDIIGTLLPVISRKVAPEKDSCVQGCWNVAILQGGNQSMDSAAVEGRKNRQGVTHRRA